MCEQFALESRSECCCGHLIVNLKSVSYLGDNLRNKVADQFLRLALAL